MKPLRWAYSSMDTKVIRLLLRHILVDVSLALSPLEIPGYVLLWILQFAYPDEMRCLKEYIAINLIQGVYNTRRRLKN